MNALKAQEVQQKTKTLIKKERFQEAHDLLFKSIPRLPPDAHLCIYYAHTCQKLGGDLIHQIPHYLLKAIRIDPHIPLAWWSLCRFMKSQKVYNLKIVETTYVAYINLEGIKARRAAFYQHVITISQQIPEFDLLHVLTKVIPDPDPKLNDLIIRFIAAYTWKTHCLPKKHAYRILFCYKYLMRHHGQIAGRKYVRNICHLLLKTNNIPLLEIFLYELSHSCNEAVSLKTVAYCIFNCLFKLFYVLGRSAVSNTLTVFMKLPMFLSALPQPCVKLIEACQQLTVNEAFSAYNIIKDIQLGSIYGHFVDKFSLVGSMELNDWESVWRKVKPAIVKKILLTSYLNNVPARHTKYSKSLHRQFGLLEIALVKLLSHSLSKKWTSMSASLATKSIECYGLSPTLLMSLIHSLGSGDDLSKSSEHRRVLYDLGFIDWVVKEQLFCCGNNPRLPPGIDQCFCTRMVLRRIHSYYCEGKLEEALGLVLTASKLSSPIVPVWKITGLLSLFKKKYAVAYYFFNRAYLVNPGSWINIKLMADLMVYNKDVNAAKWFLTSYRESFPQNRSLSLKCAHYAVVLGHNFPEGEEDRGLGVRNAYYLSNYGGQNLFTIQLLGEEHLKIGMFKAGYRCFSKTALSSQLRSYAHVKGTTCLFLLKKLKCCFKKTLDLKNNESNIHLFEFIAFMFLKLASMKIKKRGYSAARQYLQISVLYSTTCLIWNPSYITFWKYLGNALYHLSLLPSHNGFIYIPSILLHTDQEQVYVRLNQCSAMKLALRCFYMGVKWSDHAVSSLFWADIGTTFLRITDMLPENDLKSSYAHLAFQSSWNAVQVDPYQWRSWNILGISASRQKVEEPHVSFAAFEIVEFLQYTSFGTTGIFNKGLLQFKHNLVDEAAKTFDTLYVTNPSNESAWTGKILIQERLEPVNISKLLEFYIAYFQQKPGRIIAEMLTFHNKTLFKGKTVRRMYKVLKMAHLDSYTEKGGFRNALLRHCKKKKKSALQNMLVYMRKTSEVPIEACELFADILNSTRPDLALKYYLAAFPSGSAKNKLAFRAYQEKKVNESLHLLSNLCETSQNYLTEYPGILMNVFNCINLQNSESSCGLICYMVLSFNHDPSVLALSSYTAWKTKDIGILLSLLLHYGVHDVLFNVCIELFSKLSLNELVSLLKELKRKCDAPVFQLLTRLIEESGLTVPCIE